MLWLLLVSSSFFFIGLFSVFLFSIYTKLKSDNRQLQESLNKAAGAAGVVVSDREVKDDRTQLPKSLIEEILPSKSPKWEELLELCKQSVENGSGREGNGSVQERDGDGDGDGDGGSGGEDMRVVKKKKKRAKKKRLDVKNEEDVESKKEMDSDPGRLKPELVCMYPFTSTGSATQRKIKQQYDQLVKCHESKGLTLVQVGEFANCLVDAKHELQQKSEVIKRKFTIAKALLSKADRSSFDRLRQQIYKLETEQKRLEDDAFVYNWLQQQLKLSPAYKKMLELSVSMELEAKSNELMQSTDTDESADISFEELLAQEKKDSFWQKAGKSRLCST
ncbi:hypothetical protein Q3G72_015254 [Acer saccharum]|nr:hypothetical protein Q3G72_015254 [Acer saccharum]